METVEIGTTQSCTGRLLPTCSPIRPWVSEEVQKAILEHVLKQRTHEPQRVAETVLELGLKPWRSPVPMNSIDEDKRGPALGMRATEARSSHRMTGLITLRRKPQEPRHSSFRVILTAVP